MRRERRPRGHVTVGTAPASPQTGTEAQRGSLFLESAGPRRPRRLCLSHALEHGLTAAATGRGGAWLCPSKTLLVDVGTEGHASGHGTSVTPGTKLAGLTAAGQGRGGRARVAEAGAGGGG